MKTKRFVILSAAKDLWPVQRKAEILRFAQNDRQGKW